MIIIGHRGARGLAPENTLDSIQKALDYHVDEVEIDVRITKDQVPVLNHDRAILAGGKPYLIAHYTYAELKKISLELATLAEALEYVGSKAILHIEVKLGEPIGPIVAVITDFAGEADSNKMYHWRDILLGSKSQKTLRDLHRQLPDIPKVVIEPWSGVRAAYRARQVGTKRISMRSWWLWRGFLRSMHRRGYLLTPYTLNDPAKVRKWQPYIYGVVTDFPDRFTKEQP
jgi:glycerophosphoryl diester phosphodiesterase